MYLIWNKKGIMCHNSGTWHDSSLVSLISEELCQWANYKPKYEMKSQNPLGNNHASLPLEQLCQSYLGSIFPASLGKNRASLTWEWFCETNLATTVPSDCDSTWQQM